VCLVYGCVTPSLHIKDNFQQILMIKVYYKVVVGRLLEGKLFVSYAVNPPFSVAI